MKKIILLSVLLGAITNLTAQFTLDAQLRPRFEYHHGYKTLAVKDVDPSTFVSQRTRLNASYKVDYLDMYLSFQDVRVWGDVPQLNSKDNRGVTVHQAWAEIKLDNNFSTKLGRQEIVYDDSRFMGNVGWAQQGRSHDAILLKYKQNKFRFHLGLAYNQEDFSGVYKPYTLKGYKSLQYIWMHNDWNNFSGSFIFLNNGKENLDKDGTTYTQTIGTHLKSKGKQFNIISNLYYQFGENLSAYLLGLEGNYKASKKAMLGLGVELQSGTNPGETDNNSFTPLYGTNHKFNGFMDYFYVGKGVNGTYGLLDFYGKVKFKLNPKSNLLVALHNFSAAADIDKKQIGTELDFNYTYRLQKDIKIQLKYGHMFASEDYFGKDTTDETSNVAWLTLTVNPTLFTTKKVEEVNKK